MAYLHCHSCDWEQDDFYSEEGYNPASSLKNWNDILCGEKQNKIDKVFSTDSEFVRENGKITTREVIARQYEKYARKIRTMKWITWEQWEKEKDTAVCPNCGAKDFDID